MSAKETIQTDDLIYRALSFLVGQFNQWYQKRKGGLDTEPVMKLSPIVDQEGKLQVNKLGMTLINIEEEHTEISSTQIKASQVNTVGLGYKGLVPVIKIDLEVMVSSAFLTSGNYEEALKHISYAAHCFRLHSSYNKEDFPDIQPIEKLTLNLLNKDLNQLQCIWSMIGAKHIPSTMYKVKLLVIGGEQKAANVDYKERYKSIQAMTQQNNTIR